MDRRRYLALIGTTAVGGCLSAPDAGVSTPDPATDPTALLPPVPPGMGTEGAIPLDTDDIAADAAVFQQYAGDAGVRYYAEVIRWSSTQAARDGEDLYRYYDEADGEWMIYVPSGVFSCAGTTLGGDRATVIEILGEAEWLSPSFVRTNNRLEG